ncbi:hypothetical protein EBU24_03650, partial [bacterium]|nr:hypothetical protein [bacterium]
MKKLHLMIILFLPSFLWASHFNPNAFCKVPVADLVSFPLINNKNSTFTSYANIPCLGFSKKSVIPRLGQLLLHELVEIIEEKGQEVRVKISNRYYAQHGNHPVLEGFWMHKSCLQELDELSLHEQKKVPLPLDYRNRNAFQENTLVLKEPWTHIKESLFSSRSTTYSAGTRFVKAIHELETSDNYLIYLFNATKKRFEIQEIPTHFCLEENDDYLPEKRRTIFVHIIRHWAHRHNQKAFAYALGGSSLVEEVSPNNFKLEKIGPQQKLFFVRTHDHYYYANSSTHHATQTGIDCSNLITRAAQIAGIAYYAGNTTTISHELQAFTKNDVLENGDIVVWKG